MVTVHSVIELEHLERALDESGEFVLRLVKASARAFADGDPVLAQVVAALEPDVWADQQRIAVAVARVRGDRSVSDAELRRAVTVDRVNQELQAIAEQAVTVGG